MFDKLRHATAGWVEKACGWTDPAWWVVISLLLFVLFTVHLVPLKLKDDNHDLLAHIALWVRRACLAGVVGVGIVFPLVLYISFGAASQAGNDTAALLFQEWFAAMSRRYWTAPAAGVLGGLLLNLIWHRYGDPHLSNLARRFRMRQGEDRRSDVREEAGKLQSKNYDPEHHFRDGKYLLGLDENNRPVYLDAVVFEEVNSSFIAPTRYGKGVAAGVLLTQAIRRGNTVFMIDPKGDANLPYILQNEAARAGRAFVYLDLNPDGKGAWHPFKGGTLRDRRARILAAFKLEQGGTDADVYKSRERSIVDDLLRNTDGSIRAMLEHAAQRTEGSELSQLRDSLKEWSKLSTFTPPKKKEGHSIEKSLLNNAVVYVRGSLDDEVVRLATRCYIAELVQETRRLAAQRKQHLTVFVDELRFVISNELVNALATIVGFHTNLLLATQSISDLLNLQDKTINGPALQKSFEVNCQVKFIYKAGDADTARWAEALGGTKWIRVARMERLDVNRWGGEKWSDSRSMDTIEVPHVPHNVLLNLAPRVAVVYRPGAVAQTLYTCWVRVDKSVCSWTQKSTTAAPENQVDTRGEQVDETLEAPGERGGAKSIGLDEL